MAIEVRRGAERFLTAEDGRETRHSFSFGPHYDPDNLGFGGLVCHNDDRISPGAGYPDHPHQEMEIVTWVLSGALSHRDSSGRSGVITPGQVQVMSAGSGIVHSETVSPGAGPTRFVQTWVRPATWGEPPAYASADVAADLDAASGAPVGASGGWVPLASGGRDGVLPLRSPGATLWVASVAAGQRLVVPAAAYAHLFVATGAAALPDVDVDRAPGLLAKPGGATVHRPAAGLTLGEGDAVRFADEGAELLVTEPGQLMLWTFA